MSEEKQLKICIKCGIQKELVCFYKHPQGKYGRDSKCKICVLKYQKQYAKQIKNGVVNTEDNIIKIIKNK